MRDYGVVSPQFWIGATGKRLRGNPDAQLLALYLMTSPHATMIGVFHCPILYMAHETGMPFEGASNALQILIDADFCTYDEESDSVFVHRMAAFQVAESLKPGDNRIKAVAREAASIGSNLLRDAFVAMYKTAFNLSDKEESEANHKAGGSPFEAPSKPLRSPLKPLPDPLRSQEQEQEQEQAIAPPLPLARGASKAAMTARGKPSLSGFEEFWDAYPKKRSRGDAEKAWAKLDGTESSLLSRILEAVEVAKRRDDWRKEGGQFVPYPATWLRDKGWLDDGRPTTYSLDHDPMMGAV